MVRQARREFDNPMIEILDYVKDVLPLLHACALTINPQAELRGSSIKVVESVAVGRVCVSTRIGARGWLEAGFSGLVVVDRVQDFAAPIIQLLINDEARIEHEVQEQDKLAKCSWNAAGNELRDYLQRIVDVPR